MLPILSVIFMLGLCLIHMPAFVSPPPPCMMSPTHLELHLPERGFFWISGEEFSGGCDEVPADRWIRKSSGIVDLFVHPNGPEGSGRYWNITVGVAARLQSRPTRGLCLMTSTAGWRTLQRYRDGPLPWLDDLDRDGKAELIIWESFSLHLGAVQSDSALIAWVYRFVSESELALDWDLSRHMARAIADEYLSPLAAAGTRLSMLRAQASEALGLFADNRCSATHNEAP